MKEKIIEYDWNYRKKICSKCNTEQQKKRGCFRVDNFKEGIQETHCKHLTNAGTQKFRKEINEFLDDGMRKMTLDAVGMLKDD